MHAQKPIRVLFVENGIGYGGAVVCLRHLIRHLDRTRFEPFLITGMTGPEYQGIKDETPWKYIRDRYFHVVNWKSKLDSLTWPDKIPGLRWILSQTLARVDDLVNFLPFFLKLLWITRKLNPTLIHANNEPLCNRAAILVGRILRIPVICHVRGNQTGSRMMSWMFRLPDYFITVSKWVFDSIGNLGVPLERRTYIYDGIELDKLDLHADGAAWRARFGILPEDYAVGLVGLLIPWKGQRLFFQAVTILLQEIPNLKGLIVGGTPDECIPYEKELRELAGRPELAGRIIFTGHATAMAEVYNGLDIVVSASTDPEPLGTMIIESLTMARPVVAPNHGGAVEMIDTDVTGLLFQPGDAEDLASQIRRLHSEQGLSDRLGRAARAKALATFAVEEHVRRVQEIYELLLEQNATGGESRHPT